MSRVAKFPIKIPIGIKVLIDNKKNIEIKGKMGILNYKIHNDVIVKQNSHSLFFSCNKIKKSNFGWMQAGTCRSIINSMIKGVSEGFFKKLKFIGVGYRISLDKINVLKMFLGYSHPIYYNIPEFIKVEILPNNEILIKGINKQLVGQVTANIRSYRVPERYKGKGIRYHDEIINIKEAKKK